MPKKVKIVYQYTLDNLQGYIEKLAYIIYNQIFKRDSEIFAKYLKQHCFKHESDPEVKEALAAYICINFNTFGETNHNIETWFSALNISGFSRQTISTMLFGHANGFSSFNSTKYNISIQTMTPISEHTNSIEKIKTIFKAYRALISNMFPFVKVNEFFWEKFCEWLSDKEPIIINFGKENVNANN